MSINSYRKTREAYTNLLEKIVDASLRLGLELNLQQQSALAMLLEGSSYKEIAQMFGVTRSEAVTLANGAVDELGLFLNHLGSIEMMRRKQDQKIERLESQHRLQIQELNDEIAYLNKRLQSRSRSLRDLSIHHLPISPMLMSILLKAGYYTLDDVAKVDQNVLKALPGMTSDMLRLISKVIELSKK